MPAVLHTRVLHTLAAVDKFARSGTSTPLASELQSCLIASAIGVAVARGAESAARHPGGWADSKLDSGCADSQPGPPAMTVPLISTSPQVTQAMLPGPPMTHPLHLWV